MPLAPPRRRALALALFAPGNGDGVRLHVLGNHAAGTDHRAAADGDRRHQRRVGAYEGPFADLGAGLLVAVVVAGDRARADVGACADVGVADIAQMVDLGAPLDRAAFHLDEVADARALADIAAGPEPRERADLGAFSHADALQVAEGPDLDPVLDDDAGADHDVRPHGHVGS